MKRYLILTSVLFYCYLSIGKDVYCTEDEYRYTESESLFNIFAAPKQDLIVIQYKGFNSDDLDIFLKDNSGAVVQQTVLYKGSTIAWFNTETLYGGVYTIIISSGSETVIQTINLEK